MSTSSQRKSKRVTSNHIGVIDLDPNSLLIKVTDLEPLETELINLADISIQICLGMTPLVTSTFSVPEPIFVEMKELESQSIRVLIYNENQLYGTISFDKNTDFGLLGQELTQWITLFDDPDDDEYDGILGQDDEEGPRVLITFQQIPKEEAASIKKKQDSVLQHTKTQKQPEHRTFRDDDDEVQIQSVVPVPTPQQQNKTQSAIKHQRTTPKPKHEIVESVQQNEEQLHEQLCNLFGGRTQPKLAQGPIPDIPKEKKLVMAMLNEEIKKFDTKEINTQLELDVEATVIKIQNDQKMIIQEENQFVSRLNKVDYLVSDLELQDQSQKKECNKMKAFEQQTSQKFTLFESARSEIKETLTKELSQKQSELSKIKEVIENEQEAISAKKEEIAARRALDTKNVLAGNADNVQLNQELEKIEADVKTAQITSANLAAEQKKLVQAVLDQKENYDKKVNEMNRVLETSGQLRQVAQDDHIKFEQQAFEEVCKNLDFKRHHFQLNYQVVHFTAQISIYERRVKLLSEKKIILGHELANVNALQTKEVKRLNKELADLTGLLQNAKENYESKLASFQQLQTSNEKQKSLKWEQKIEDLEAQLRKAERIRGQQQLSLQNFHRSLNLKLNLLTDPHDDVAAPAKEYFLSKRDKLNEEVKKRSDQKAELQKRIDELRRRNQCGETNDVLIDSYKKADQELDKVNDELNRQMKDLTDKISQSKILMDQKERQLQDQITELQKLKDLLNDQDREIAILKKNIADLILRNQRYDNDITRLQQEKESLGQYINELENLIKNREQERDDAENQLKKADKNITYLSRLLKGKEKEPDLLPELLPQLKGYKATNGDVLDEMLGQYINKTGCTVPIKKLGDGYYLFGTRKIYAKILNGKLVIRVGGGYMIIEEFISTYAEKELIKMDSIKSDQVKFEKPKPQRKDGSPGPVKKQQTLDSVYEAQPNVLLSGTHHTKRLTEAQLNKLRNSSQGALRELKQ